MKTIKSLIVLSFTSIFLVSCYNSVLNPISTQDGSTDGVDWNNQCPEGTTPFYKEIPVQEFVGVDILVVVDNSGSMAAEQAMLRDAFPDLLRSILTGQDIETGRQLHEPVRDLHIGVVSTDMGVGGYSVQTCENDPLAGDDGILQHTPRGGDCDAAYPNYLSYSISPTEDPDMTDVDKLARDFGCLAVLGTNGCGFEQQLEAAYKALKDHSQPGGENAGFLRPDSILVVLFVTDEEDCSAADLSIFDISGLHYSINLQCYYQREKLFPIDRYLTAFRDLRPNFDNFVAGFIVGVPPGDPACEGNGYQVAGCLERWAMQEVLRPDGELLEYVCQSPSTCTPPDPPYPGDCVAEAFPGRRFVQLAQEIGENAVVQSICTESFVPAVSALTKKLREAIKDQAFRQSFQPEKDPANECRCTIPCTIIEELSDNGPCPEATSAYDGNNDTIPDVRIDPDTGQAHTLCEIPQAGAIINSGTNCSMACSDPDAVYSKDPEILGWWYDPTQDVDGDTIPDPTITFTGVEPESGSSVAIECCLP